MEFFELIQNRQSGRSYDVKGVAREKLVKIMEAGVIAPSACNSQPWRFIAVTDPQLVKQMPPMLQRPGLPINKFTDECPAFIVICEAPAVLMSSMRETTPSQKYAQMDVGIATAHMTLAATELGLASCILGCFDEAQIKALCNIPEEFTIRLVLAVGYAKHGDPIRPKKRKEFDEVARFESWQ